MQNVLPHLSFLDGTLDLSTELPGSYNWLMVILSVLIAALGAYAALGGAGRISATQAVSTKRIWLITGAAAMGIGIWAMHFIGMLAFSLPVPVAYNIPITTVSVIPAILASALVLHIISGQRIGALRLIVSGLLMGAGIGLMHYIGMAAMRMNALMGYDPIMFGVSIVVAVILAITAIATKFLATNDKQSMVHWTNFAAAFIMGGAVAGMHYTGMAAVHFFPSTTSIPVGNVLDPVLLATWVCLAAALIIGVAILVIVIDRRLEAARRYNRELERVVTERTSELAAANEKITTLNSQLETENSRLGAELDVTRRLQMMLLPAEKELAEVVGLDLACYMLPAEEVGGDYYDVLQHNGRIKIGIGDVTGHGLESGVVMLMTQAVVRALLVNGETDPVRFLAALNHTLFSNVQRMGSDKNMTLCLLDYCSGEVKISGQHEHMIVVRADKTIELVDTIDLGFPVGLESDIANYVDQTTVQLKAGDGVVLYTDGITEAENMAGEQYAIERLCKVIKQNWSLRSEEIKEAIVADVKRHVGKQTVYDDITLVVAKQKDDPLSQLAASKIFGDFKEPRTLNGEFLKIGFHPNSIPLQQRWRNNGISADFLADYASTFFPGNDFAQDARQANIKDSISFIANELIENAMKYNSGASHQSVSIEMFLDEDKIKLYSTNQIVPNQIGNYQALLNRILTEDRQTLYTEQLEKNLDDGGSSSGLGYLTIFNDYNAHLAWKFSNNPRKENEISVTTMVELAVQ